MPHAVVVILGRGRQRRWLGCSGDDLGRRGSRSRWSGLTDRSGGCDQNSLFRPALCNDRSVDFSPHCGCWRHDIGRLSGEDGLYDWCAMDSLSNGDGGARSGSAIDRNDRVFQRSLPQSSSVDDVVF